MCTHMHTCAHPHHTQKYFNIQGQWEQEGGTLWIKIEHHQMEKFCMCVEAGTQRKRGRHHRATWRHSEGNLPLGILITSEPRHSSWKRRFQVENTETVWKSLLQQLGPLQICCPCNGVIDLLFLHDSWASWESWESFSRDTRKTGRGRHLIEKPAQSHGLHQWKD